MSKIIVIEGPDRCGKATQSKLLCEHFKSIGKRAEVVEVPIHSNFAYSIIYFMLKMGLAKISPKIFQWFQYLNRQIFQWQELPKLEEKCDYIIFDRWYLSSVIYGEATGVSEEFTRNLCRRLRNPDFTVILLGASHKHEAEDSYEADLDLQKRVRNLYQDWAATHPGRSVVLDCSRTREDISQEIQKTLEELDLI